jgi:hydrogenase/urease accessory protein HupE
MKSPLVLWFALVTPTLSAHEIGTTQVAASFLKDHTYRIDVVTAPRALLHRLEDAAAKPRTQGSSPSELEARLEQSVSQIQESAEVFFNDTRIAPTVEVIPIQEPADPSEPLFVVIRLTGPIPQHANTFAWRWLRTYSAYALTLENQGHGQPQRQWLDADQASTPFPLARDLATPTRAEIARQYLILGFTHIVPYGYDHVLFVLGTFLLTTKWRPILAQVTAFTIAHSITLGLTIYGLVSLSPRVVEPLIALSIVYVAMENVVTSELKPWRVAIVFGFGLLHGMGFAGVLKELGLPRAEFLTGLLAFNIGVELGQLAVIGCAFLLVVRWIQDKSWYRTRFVIPSSLAIACAGLFWTAQRTWG